mgnify:CR=1 FL=1
MGDVVKNNIVDNEAVARALGLKKVFDLGYRNHMMDNYSMQDIRGRLIFLFRVLKVDTIISYDPWGHYEENPDHYVTARAVEAAMFLFFNNRMGCGSSLLISAVITVLLLYALGWIRLG